MEEDRLKKARKEEKRIKNCEAARKSRQKKIDTI